LDKWEESTLALMCRIGVEKFNSVFEGSPDKDYPKPTASTDGVKVIILS